jgi:hypothetical protein
MEVTKSVCRAGNVAVQAEKQSVEARAETASGRDAGGVATR